jgi:hypothetical protein
VYGIHNNHDHIDEGERVKGDRGWEKGEGGRKERCGRKMKETGDKAKKGKKEKGVEGERKKKRSGRRLPPPVSLHPFPLIYVVMIVVNTIHTFVLLGDGNLIFWWPSVIHV